MGLRARPHATSWGELNVSQTDKSKRFFGARSGTQSESSGVSRTRRSTRRVAAWTATLMALTLSLTPGVSWAESDPEPTPTASVLKVDALETALTGDDTSEKGSGEVTASPSNTPDSKPSASETQTTDPEAGKPNDATPDAADTTQTPSTNTTDAGQEGIRPMVVGPEPVTGNYMYWTVTDTAGTLVGGATTQVQGPRNNSNTNSDDRYQNWQTTRDVTDCVSTPCTGLDVDPDPGEFQVVSSVNGFPTISNSGANSRWRVRQASTAPAGYTWNANQAWLAITGSGEDANANQWTQVGTYYRHDFGTFRVRALTNTVVVTKRDMRTGLGAAATSATATTGARFGLFESNTSTTPLFECTTIADGTCTFPNVNATGQFWVGELDPVPGSAAANAYTAPITTFNAGGSDRPYRYRTPSLMGNG